MKKRYQALLNRVTNPSRYTGNEFNSVHKEAGEFSVHACLAFPDKYDIGSSHSGLKLLYHLVNDHEGIFAERIYVPEDDFIELLLEEKLPIPSLESKTPLNQFDLLGFSLQYELSYTNILFLLDLGAIPLKSKERGENDPLVVAGGPAGFNPEPLADFIDIFFIGDGEQLLVSFLELMKVMKEKDLSRSEKLALSYALTYQKEGVLETEKAKELYSFFAETYTPEKLRGLYFPNFSKFDESGKRLLHLDGAELKVKKAEIADLEDVKVTPNIIIPFGESVHNRISIEVDRGCTQGCRYCQAGYIYRPVRERTPETIQQMVVDTTKKTGYDEISYLSLSLGDFKGLEATHNLVHDYVEKNNISLSYPSLRSGTITSSMMQGKARSSSYTITIEAATERLRNVINKKITDKELYDTVEEIAKAGYQKIKIYTMIGLPTETEEDVRMIGALAVDIHNFAKDINGKGFLNINLAVSPFVPKSHTPFQWEAQEKPDDLWKKICIIKDATRTKKNIKVKWGDTFTAFLEGIFARGGREAGNILLKAYQNGAKLDAWYEYFNREAWDKALEGEDEYLDNLLWQEQPEDTIFPFEHIETGITKDFLWREYKNGVTGKLVPDCREDDLCFKCGLEVEGCNKNIFSGEVIEPEEKVSKKVVDTIENEHIYKIAFTRLGETKYLSHLEAIDFMIRFFRRMSLPLYYSKGLHPRPKLIFSTNALPVGLESNYEELVISLKNRLSKTEEELLADFNTSTVKGITFIGIREVRLPDKKKGFQLPEKRQYSMDFIGDTGNIYAVVDALNNASELIVAKGGKKAKEKNIKEEKGFRLKVVSAEPETRVELTIPTIYTSFWMIQGVAKHLVAELGGNASCVNIRKLTA